MSARRQKSGIDRSSVVVVVAVKAAKEISRTALTWALTNVVQPGDCVRLLVVIPPHSSTSIGKKLWGFPNFHNDCATGYWSFMSGTIIEQKEYFTDICNEIMCQLHHIYDPEKVTVKMKVIYASKDGVVAAEAKRTQAHWVVLDKRMEKEANSCTEQLDCNIVVVRNSETKVLRLNLNEPRKALLHSKSSRKRLEDDLTMLNTIKVPNVTPISSPDRISSMSSLDMFTSQSFMSDIDLEPKVKQISPLSMGEYYYDGCDSESDSDNLSSVSTSIGSQQWMEDNLSSADEGGKLLKECLQRSSSKASNSMSETSKAFEEGRNVREMISLDKNAPPDPPPLCSVCRHKSPSVGKPPRLFAYAELERATRGFSEANFLAEGGYGSVHQGILPDGQVIAVKQHKLASTQGDREFCSEVQALSCAQHRNVVMLIGYCVEGERRLLVYEYICNSSLDSHLYGRKKNPLDWDARRKIAVGAARGLRYLHEECRVGCIVHRDMRPNNILLTHDFDALVGDFGLARLQGDGDSVAETRIIGTFGYLAPEYAQTGQVSEKADVYAFGVVLVELVTGRKAVDIHRPKGEQCLAEWARPLLEEGALSKHVDPCLNNCYSEREVEATLHCASLCLQRDPYLRPPMSQVLRLLEGDISIR
ncbi:kinase with adenine nucleotide alpha hydrolases-like domain-containing protein [Perilla frutescens var. hirtella]|uniref:Kinase with adenine nucleotide alpha hydrolases-like domain-containing protein n=1 Tax=Perilla frutescens var. hirtella TaxID=608512 RepID=A0AAD4P845_PERFH|nr:kinase with adenine nucleotide alpha hydrolases-like domain-containing protein [Perilla frutescens var. hirtella]